MKILFGVVLTLFTEVWCQYGPLPSKTGPRRTTTTTLEPPLSSNEVVPPGLLPDNRATNFWWQGPASPFKAGASPSNHGCANGFQCQGTGEQGQQPGSPGQYGPGQQQQPGGHGQSPGHHQPGQQQQPGGHDPRPGHHQPGQPQQPGGYQPGGHGQSPGHHQPGQQQPGGHGQNPGHHQPGQQQQPGQHQPGGYPQRPGHHQPGQQQPGNHGCANGYQCQVVAPQPGYPQQPSSQQPGFQRPPGTRPQQPGYPQQPGFQQPSGQQPGFQRPPGTRPQEPGYPQQPGGQQPGYPQKPGFQQPSGQQPGYPQQPGFQQPTGQQPGYPQQPGFNPQPSYPFQNGQLNQPALPQPDNNLQPPHQGSSSPQTNPDKPIDISSNPFLSSALQKPVPGSQDCTAPNAYCVPQNICYNGIIYQQQSPQQLKRGPCSGNDVCCKTGKPVQGPSQSYQPSPTGNQPSGQGYQPQPTPSYVTDRPVDKYTGPLNTTPYPGCAAALKCVSEIYCTAQGVMSDTPVQLTREDLLNKVPLTDCQDMETGIIGKCCRDPNYKDPWPAGMMMKKTGFDDGLYKGESSGFDDGQYRPEHHEPTSPHSGHTINKPVGVFNTEVTQFPPSVTASKPRPGQTHSQVFPNNEDKGSGYFPPSQPGVSPQRKQQPPFPPQEQGSYRPNPPQQQGYRPSTPQQVSPPRQPTPQPSYPQQQPNFPQQPSQQKPNFPQQPSQQPSFPQQQPNFPQQQPSFPQQQPNFPQQQPNVPQQQPNFPQQQPNVPQQQPNFPQQQPNFPQQQPSFPQQQPNFPQQQPSYQPQGPPRQPSQSPVPFPPPYPGQTTPSEVGSAQVVPGEGCGVRRPPYSGDGPETNPGEFPWQAIVLTAGNRSALCSGSIISDNAILTSANCVNGFEGKDLLVKVGSHSLNSPNGASQIRTVAAVVPHPSFDSGSLAKDQAVLALSEPLKLDQQVDKICLPEPEKEQQLQNGRKCFVTGYGRPNLQAGLPGTSVNKVPVELMPNNQCENALKQTHLGKYFILNEGFTCALPKQSDFCKVDIGSGLACDRGDGHFELVGVYSWDTQCSSQAPAVMASCDSKWIGQVLSTPLDVLQAEQNKPKFEFSRPEDIDQKPGFALGYGK